LCHADLGAYFQLMRQRPFAVRICLLCLACGTFLETHSAEQTRFRNLLKTYHCAEFISEDRGMILDIARLSNHGTAAVDSLTSDTTRSSQNAIGVLAAFELARRTGAQKRDREETHAVSLAALHHTAIHSVHGLKSPGGLICPGNDPNDTNCIYTGGGQSFSDTDTVTVSVDLRGAHRYMSSYFIKPQQPLSPFFTLDATADWSASFRSDQNVSPGIPDADLSDKYIGNTSTGALCGQISPGAGLGRQANVTPLYQALELEQELMRCGALRFPLSDSALLTIAALVARNDSYKLRGPERFKTFKEALDSLIFHDAAVDTANLHYLSHFPVKRLLLHNEAPFMSGARFSLFGRESVAASLSRLHSTYRNTLGGSSSDAVAFSHTVRQSARLLCDFRAGLPLTLRWFVSIGGEKTLLSSVAGEGLARDNESLGEELAEANWSFLSSFAASSRLIVYAGADRIASRVVLPKDWPTRSWLAANFQIEDYLSMSITFSLHHADTLDGVGLAGTPRVYEGPSASVRVFYGF
jgi:hypothetical protein